MTQQADTTRWPDLDGQAIRERLDRPLELRVPGSAESTNALAKAWAREGAPHGACVLTARQAAGRGRFSRPFFSPEGGLYLSLVIDSGVCTPGRMTTLAAVAAMEAIAGVCGIQVGIKWVNDLMWKGRKLGGILTEGVLRDGVLDRAVIGLGINVFDVDFPEDLRQSAISLGLEGLPYARERLAAGFINRFLDRLPLAPAHMAAYHAACVTLGRRVKYETGAGPEYGLALDVDDEGALIVKGEAGERRLLAGEVSLMKE